MTGISFDGMQQPSALTLRQLTGYVGNVLRMSRQLQQVWVVAEMSDVRTSGGHCYMELVEKNEEGQTVAKIRANIWSSTYVGLAAKFRNATGQVIAAGMKVMVCGSITYHSIYGLSFNITDIDPAYTLGDMERIRREILEQLARENIAEANKQRVLPMNPQRIAVISAAGAAGYGDFCNQLHANNAGFVFYTHLFGAIMQGERTAQSVMAALEQVEMSIDLWDCVVIIRGGGATTDLNGFDNLDLARRVAQFPLPVVVGIGHERDMTVLDYIAHTRCKTPTAVAEFLVESLRNAASTVSSHVQNIIRYCTERVHGEQQRLSAAASMIPTIATARVSQARTRLQAAASLLPVSAAARITAARSRLSTILAAAGNAATTKIAMQRTRLDAVPDQLTRAAQTALARQSDRLLCLGSLIGVLDPRATLRRGYSITRIGGKAVTSAAGITPGAVVTTVLAEGTVTSTVNETSQNEQI